MPLLPAWVHDKIGRKAQWASAGVEEVFLVPTLLSSGLAWDGTRLEVPYLVEDAEGHWVPNLEQGAPVQTVEAPDCARRLHRLLLEHGRLVLKPSKGSQSRGVLLLSVEADPFRGVPTASGVARPLPVAAADVGAGAGEGAGAGAGAGAGDELVWVTTPCKVVSGADDVAYRAPWAEVQRP